MNTEAVVNTDKVLESDAQVRRLKKPSSDWHDHKTSFPGLRLRHYASGLKTWFLHARIAGKGPAWVPLGEYPDKNMDAAQLACAEARALMRQGIDPRKQREDDNAAKRAKALTFGEASEEWIDEQCKRKNKPWRATTREKVEYVLLGGRLESWRDRPLGSIKDDDVQAVIEELEPNSQQTFLAPIRGLFKWAVRRGYRSESPVKGVTAPAPEGDAAPLIVFEEEGEPDFGELKALLACLDALQAALPLSPWPTIYRLGLLTGARYSEVVGLPRAEVDLARGIWTLPASRSKVKEECERPLSAAVVEVLRAIPGEGELFFPGKIKGQALSKTGREPAALNAMLAEKGFKKGFWYGRLRDTVASWLEFQQDATERAMAVILNHKPPRDNTRRRHYTMISGRKQARVLLERWAAQVQHVLDGTAATVHPLRKLA